MNQDQYNNLRTALNNQVIIAREILADYTKRVSQNPTMPISWNTDGAIHATALATIYGALVEQLEKEGVKFDVHTRAKLLTTAVVQRAMSVEDGSNQTHNTLKRTELAIMAQLANTLNQFCEANPA